VYQCKYIRQYFLQNIFYNSLIYYPGGPLLLFIPPYPYNLHPQYYLNLQTVACNSPQPPASVTNTNHRIIPPLPELRTLTSAQSPDSTNYLCTTSSTPDTPAPNTSLIEFDHKYLQSPAPDLDDPHKKFGPEIQYGIFTKEDKWMIPEEIFLVYSWPTPVIPLKKTP